MRWALLNDSDATIASAIGASVKPASVGDDDIIAAANAVRGLRPALMTSDDAVYAFTTTRFLQPALVTSGDGIIAADVGWHLFADAPVTDGDEVHAVNVEAWAYIVPDDAFRDEENVDTYPFYLQRLDGGIPVPPPPGLTGSFPRRVLLRAPLRADRL